MEIERIQKVIHTYYEKKDEMLRDNAYNEAEWKAFFAPTEKGNITYRREKELLKKQISHFAKYVGYRAYDIDESWMQWQTVVWVESLCRISVVHTNKVRYKALGNKVSLEKTLHDITLIKYDGTWYIETDEYTNEFSKIERIPKNKRIYKEGQKQDLKESGMYTRAPLGVYVREKAVAYAMQYATTPNEEYWKNYGDWGGDCTNFVSQCLYAGEIPFDHAGQFITEKWYWYSDQTRTPSWTGANAFKLYMLTNKGYGLVAEVADMQDMEIGDVVQLGDLEEATHTMIVVDILYKDETKEEIEDLLIAQHSTTDGIWGYGIPLSTKPENRLYYKIVGYNL